MARATLLTENAAPIRRTTDPESRAAWFWIFVAGISVILAAFRAHSALTNGLLGESTGDEFTSLANLRWVAGGEAIYSDPFTYPYRNSMFNWLFYRCYAFVISVAASSGPGAVMGARVTTLIFALSGVAATVAFLVRAPSVRQTLGRNVRLSTSLGVALFIWVGPVVSWWALTARPDIAALCCEFCGLLVIIWNLEKRSMRRLAIAACLFFAAWSFKQSSIGIFAGVTIALLALREWKLTFTHVALFGIPVVIAILALLGAYGMDYLKNVLFVLALPGYSFESIVATSTRFIRSGGWVLLYAPAFAWIARSSGLSLRIRRASAGYYLAVVFFTCLSIAVATASQEMGDRNYFFSSWVVGMVGAFLLHLRVADELIGNARAMRWVNSALGIFAGLFVVQAVLLVFSPFGTITLPFIQPRPALAAQINRTPGPVLVESDTLALQLANRASAQSPRIDRLLYDPAEKAGLITDGGIGRRIDEKYFRSVWLFPDSSRWKARAEEAGYARCESSSAAVRYSRNGC